MPAIRTGWIDRSLVMTASGLGNPSLNRQQSRFPGESASVAAGIVSPQMGNAKNVSGAWSSSTCEYEVTGTVSFWSF